jgi:uncharacterized protein
MQRVTTDMPQEDPAARAYPSRTEETRAGRGLVATEDLEAGAVVEIFAGPAVKFSEVPEEEIRYALLFDEAWVLPRTNARYINHSCEANCFVSDTREVVAKRRIAAGEELTITYNGTSMEELLSRSAPEDAWDARWTFDCRCGSPRCIRKIDRYVVVTPDDGNSRNVALGVSKHKGRGVFARRPIATGEVFETAPVLVVPAAEWSSIENTVFFDYTFEWGWDGESAAIALGYGSLYNHSYTPNARYEKRLEDAAIDFVALREIQTGEEILINYNGKPEARDPLWFTVEDEP